MTFTQDVKSLSSLSTVDLKLDNVSEPRVNFSENNLRLREINVNNLQNLKYLKISGDLEQITGFSSLENLQQLDIYPCPFAASLYEQGFPIFNNLKYLNLHGVESEDLDWIPLLPALQSLTLYPTTEIIVTNILNFPNLNTLTIGNGVSISGECWTSVRCLYLNCNIEDELLDLNIFPNLKVIGGTVVALEDYHSIIIDLFPNIVIDILNPLPFPTSPRRLSGLLTRVFHGDSEAFEEFSQLSSTIDRRIGFTKLDNTKV
ncbi:hypothetical protein GEMRC1_012813 [Eukaryota sp. GEM-RC1]